MREAGYWERRDIQEMICRTPAVFCEELGEKSTFLVARFNRLTLYRTV